MNCRWLICWVVPFFSLGFAQQLLPPAIMPAPIAWQTDGDLDGLYRSFNIKFFSQKLPVSGVEVRWDDALPDDAGTWATKYEGEGLRFKIHVSTRLLGCFNCTAMAVLHEMVHVKLTDPSHIHGHSQDPHGKRFQHEMLFLAKSGALTDYW